MKKNISILMVLVLTIVLFAGCAKKETTNVQSDATTEAKEAVTTDAATTEAATTEEPIEIEFFQYKTEAIETFDALIAKFQEQNPNITVIQSSPPEAGTVIKTRVAAGEVPDIVGVGADNTYSDLAAAGIFKDLTDLPELSNVQAAYVQTIKDVSKMDKVYAIPYATNADAVIYNKTIFKELGLEIPKTWDEFIAVAEKAKAAGTTPFYFTFKDAWTTLPAFNVIAANTAGDDFFKKLNAGETTFAEGYKVAMENFLQLLAYGHDDDFGKTYADGNTAFANGESAMYLQGIWAIAEIQKANPEIDLGVFPYPVGSPAKVVSGVDLLLAVSETSENQEAALMFIDFLMSEENAKQYVDEQKCFSAVKGVTQELPVLDGLKESFDNGNLIDFPDHYVPSSMALDKVLQEFVQTKDVEATLELMDSEWKTYIDRQ